MRVELLPLCLLPLLACGCAKRAPATAPQMGRITIGVTTQAANNDAARMTFAIDIQPIGTVESIQADAGTYDEDLPPGEYVVRLTRLPATCRVNGLPERRVTVLSRRTTAIRYSVTCR